MLVFLVLGAILRTLQGASLVSPHKYNSMVAVNMSNLMAPECPVSPDDGSEQLRTIYDIVQSCLLTIFACVWTSTHPNINGPWDSGWTCLKRKMIVTLYGLIAPEMVLSWALRQNLGAKEIAEKYNEEFARTG